MPTAEEKLKELYKAEEYTSATTDEMMRGSIIRLPKRQGISVAARDIDLIADLVVERLLKAGE